MRIFAKQLVGWRNVTFINAIRYPPKQGQAPKHSESFGGGDWAPFTQEKVGEGNKQNPRHPGPPTWPEVRDLDLFKNPTQNTPKHLSFGMTGCLGKRNMCMKPPLVQFPVIELCRVSQGFAAVPLIKHQKKKQVNYDHVKPGKSVMFKTTQNGT